MATPPVLYQNGIHASRPAADSGCVLYTCETHGLIYRSDGSTWSTWLTLPTASATTWADLDDDHDAHDHTGVPGVGGAGGGWELDIDESGASIANMTSQSGTWGVSGGIIQQTSGTVGPARISHNTLVPIALPTVMQVECRAPSAGQSTQASMGMGFIFGTLTTPGSGSLFPMIRWNSGAAAPRVVVENDANAEIHTRNVAGLVYDTWYTLRCVFGGGRTSIYIAGVNSDLPILTAYVAPLAAGEKVGLGTTQGLKADFRNLKVWTPTQP